MKKRHGMHIFWGIAVIIVAVCLLLNGIGIFTADFHTLLMTLIMVLILIHGCTKLSFSEICLAAVHLVYIYRAYIGMPEQLKSWTLILAGTLIGVGLDLIFRNVRHRVEVKNYGSSNYRDGDEVSSTTVGSSVNIDNSFGARNDRVQSDSFQRATIKNSFGKLSVHIEDVIPASNSVVIKLENGFGNIDLYLPATWRCDMEKSNGFGNVDVDGVPSSMPDAVTAIIDIQNGFGHVAIHFV